jgi:type II secretory pathway pseudopilin PulG
VLLEIVLVVAVLAAVVVLVGAPLRPGREQARETTQHARRAELEALRDAKYREIRDAELDHRTGKLSEADWRAEDRRLRREAIELLRRLDELG